MIGSNCFSFVGRWNFRGYLKLSGWNGNANLPSIIQNRQIDFLTNEGKEGKSKELLYLVVGFFRNWIFLDRRGGDLIFNHGKILPVFNEYSPQEWEIWRSLIGQKIEASHFSMSEKNSKSRSNQTQTTKPPTIKKNAKQNVTQYVSVIYFWILSLFFVEPSWQTLGV